MTFDPIAIAQLVVLVFIAFKKPLIKTEYRVKPQESVVNPPNVVREPVDHIPMCSSISFRLKGGSRQVFHTNPQCPSHNTDETLESLVAARSKIPYSTNNHRIV
jgi:hypothetical protein